MASRRNGSGLCPAALHGLDYEGQPCDQCDREDEEMATLAARYKWGVWWEPADGRPGGWCHGAGSEGPVALEACVEWLNVGCATQNDLYLITRWSKNGPGRELVAEWWELWWVKPGTHPLFIRSYGMPIPPFVPDGCFPTKAGAVEEKRLRSCSYDRIFHVRRYRSLSFGQGHRQATIATKTKTKKAKRAP